MLTWLCRACWKNVLLGFSFLAVGLDSVCSLLWWVPTGKARREHLRLEAGLLFRIRSLEREKAFLEEELRLALERVQIAELEMEARGVSGPRRVK